MLKLGRDDALVDKLGALAANVVEEALKCGRAQGLAALSGPA